MKPIEQNSTLKNILYILAGLGGISLIILIHEMGHFLFAKMFNVPTPVFSLGFGPALFSLPIGQTIFQVALFPIGGYVEMDPEVLAQQAYIPKMLIIFGGILFNLIFAYIVLLFYTMRNQYTLTPVIDKVIPHSPAARAGLLPKDTIIAYNHEPVESNLRTILNAITTSENKIITLTIERNGTTHDISVLLDMEHPLFGSSARWLGIELEKSTTKKPSLSSHLQEGHKKFTATTQEMSHAVTTMVTKKKHQNMIIGPIGIISIIGKSLAIKPELYWFILAIISLNIGLFNILPLPFLDGGKALLFTIEALTGTTIPAHIVWIISIIFLVLFIFFIATITMNDVKRLWKK
jgi:regulator of sigma E protease